MRASISLGRWFGVPIGLHYSWFVIAWLIALSLTAQFAAVNPRWPSSVLWTLSGITAVLFFVSIVLHELSHAAVARANGIPVRGITLFALGGLAHIEKEAATPGKEFWMAIAGPIASIVIGAVCWLLSRAAPYSAFGAVFGWLAYINIALALFNLVPGFPLDGGRVLRAIVWAIAHNADRATRIAARVGQVIAFVFIAGGLFSAFTRGDFGGLWIAFIGWFLLEGAQAYYAQTQLSAALRGLRVADVMAHDCAAVDASITLREFVDRILLHGGSRCYAVYGDDAVVGIITPNDVARVDRGLWDTTTVFQTMRTLQSLHPVRPDATADTALALMARENINQLPVMSDGHLDGVVTRSYLVQLLEDRRRLAA